MLKFYIAVILVSIFGLMLFKMPKQKIKPLKFVETMFGFSGGIISEKVDSVINELEPVQEVGLYK